MQYDVDTPEQYLAVLEGDWRRETLLELRSLILSLAPAYTECIRYRMLSYDDADGPVLALNAQKGYVSLYTGDARKVDPGGSLLEGLDRGKGCIRFRKSRKVEDTKIARFIEKVVEIRARGGDVGC